MKINLKTLAAVLAVSTVLTGCSKGDTASSGGSSSNLIANTSGNTSTPAESAIQNTMEAPTDTDCAITFDGDKITATGDGAKVSGNTVSISKAGVYELSGSSPDCKIEINADKNAEITLILNNAELTSKKGSVIDCEKAKTLVLYSNNGTKNTLSDSENYTFTDDTEPDAAVFTRSDLIFNGGGELTVNGNYGDAVKCKDAIVIYEGTVNINAADDGITGKDSVTVCGGTVNVTSDGDGIKSTNDTDEGKGYIAIAGGEINVASETDGIQAETDLTVSGGKITVVAGGEDADKEVTAQDSPWDFDRRGGGMGGWGNQGSSSQNTVSQKGIKAGGDITISGGEFNIKSADDSIHSNASVEIKNGTFTLSSGDDGIHADESLIISDGTIDVIKSYEGLEGKNIEISGGTISVVAADDGINAAGGDNGSFFGYGAASDEYYIAISGGNITVNASGDGIDSNGTIAQSGGVLTIFGPTSSGNGAIDYERSYTMSGGTLIAFGSLGMAQTPSTLSQPCISVNFNASAGDLIEVRDGDKVIISETTPKNAQSLIFSCEDFKAGTEYSVYVGGSLASAVTAVDGVAGNGGQGGGPGGMGGWGGPGGMGGERPGRGQGGLSGQGQLPEMPNGEMPDMQGERPEKPR